MVTFLQRTFTSLVHAHAGRTQIAARGHILLRSFLCLSLRSIFTQKRSPQYVPVSKALSELSMTKIPDFLVIAVLFPVLWLIATKQIREMARMEKCIDSDISRSISTSRWGSSLVNGVQFAGCSRIHRLDDGYVIEVMRIFGGGKLWLPRSAINNASRFPKKSFLSQSGVVISWESHQVTLYGTLASQIA